MHMEVPDTEGHTEPAHDGDEIQINLESRPPENLRDCWMRLFSVISVYWMVSEIFSF